MVYDLIYLFEVTQVVWWSIAACLRKEAARIGGTDRTLIAGPLKITITFLLPYLAFFEGNKNGIFPGKDMPFRRGNNSIRTL